MSRGDKIRVLIVDDVAETRENIRKLLQFENDIDVIGAARTGREAVQLCTELRPDVVIMDINMPDMDGITATETIRRAIPYIQVVILSVQGDSSYMRRAMLAGARDFLTKPPAVDELRAEGTVKGLQAALKSVYNFYYGYDPAFTRWIYGPYLALDSALTFYATLLKNKGNKTGLQKPDGSGIVGTPIGRDELIRQLQYEMIPYSPEELVTIANKEFAWCDTEMLKASRDMGFEDNWKAALEKVKNTYVPEGRQPQMIMDLYHQSIDFIKQHDMVTIPPLAEETWRMTMMSPAQQLVSPFFLGGELLQISYPTNTMDSASRMMSIRGNSPHFSRATVHHELIAGHHLQGFMYNRFKSYRNFETPFWTEGWSLYWEFLLWDAQFPRSPEDRVGMLFWRMHRCARIIFSLN